MRLASLKMKILALLPLFVLGGSSLAAATHDYIALGNGTLLNVCKNFLARFVTSIQKLDPIIDYSSSTTRQLQKELAKFPRLIAICHSPDTTFSHPEIQR